MRNPNPYSAQQQMIQLIRDIRQAQRNLFVIKEVQQDVEVLPADTLKVRTARPDPGFDDMGNIRELTPTLLKELRGKEGLPGYKADRGDLKNGQTVLVVVSREQEGCQTAGHAGHHPCPAQVGSRPWGRPLACHSAAGQRPAPRIAGSADLRLDQFLGRLRLHRNRFGPTAMLENLAPGRRMSQTSPNSPSRRMR